MLKKLKCWWLGHDPDYTGSNNTHCKRCDLWDVDYYDLVNPGGKYQRIKDFFKYWFFRKWFPKKCSDCGKRYKCDESIDHIPF